MSRAHEPASVRRPMNVEETADYCGRSANFVRRVLRYEVPVVQHGHRGPLGFWPQDIDRWLARHTHEPIT